MVKIVNFLGIKLSFKRLSNSSENQISESFLLINYLRIAYFEVLKGLLSSETDKMIEIKKEIDNQIIYEFGQNIDFSMHKKLENIQYIKF